MKQLKLSPRLQTVASYIAPDSSLADIGTDHGYLPVYCLQAGLCRHLIASDIAPGPLAAAKKTALEYNCSNDITFLCAPGLDGLAPEDADTITIAGMGGETIQGILEAAPWTKNTGIHLVLQPQSKLPELQRWLEKEGYQVEHARLAREGRRLYLVLSVYYKPSSADGNQVFWMNLLREDPLCGAFAKHQLERLNKELRGLELSGQNPAQAQRLRQIAETLRRFL